MTHSTKSATPSRAAAAAVTHPLPAAHTATLDNVPIEYLFVDLASQGGYARDLNEHNVKRLEAHFDLAAIGTIYISERSARRFAVIDGQHRVEVARRCGVPEVPCLIFHGLDRAAEADLYTKFGIQLRQDPYVRFWARYLAGDPVTHTIVQTLADLGLELKTSVSGQQVSATSSRYQGPILAVAGVEDIYVRSGASVLRQVLSIARDAWGHDQRGYTSMMLRGLHAFWLRYHLQIDRARLVDKLKIAGHAGVYGRALALRSALHKTPVNAVGLALREIYVDQLRSHTLPDWQDRLVEVSDAPRSRQRRIATARSERQELHESLLV